VELTHPQVALIPDFKETGVFRYAAHAAHLVHIATHWIALMLNNRLVCRVLCVIRALFGVGISVEGLRLYDCAKRRPFHAITGCPLYPACDSSKSGSGAVVSDSFLSLRRSRWICPSKYLMHLCLWVCFFVVVSSALECCSAVCQARV
jgi:hypothetical protein